MLVMIDPYANRAERVYVVELIHTFDDDGPRTDEYELPGRFAFISDALRAYPGATLSASIARQFARIAAAADFREDRRRRRHIPIG